MSKKKIAVIGVIVILLALLAGVTYSAITRQAVARNVITTGKIDIALEERGAASGSYAQPIPMLPGTAVDLAATLRNVETTQPAWVRARVDVELRDIVNYPVSVTPEELASILHLPQGRGWVEKDGWLYYDGELKPGQTTGDVFTSVTFAADMPNKFQNCTASVTVIAQAVQVKNNGSTVFEALGWPAE